MIQFKQCYKFILLVIVICLLLRVANADIFIDSSKRQFWYKQQKGANIFNQSIFLEDIRAAKKYGIKFLRLAPDKFISSKRDFLIGDADDYRGLIKEDLTKLKQILNMCLQEEMPVVITVLSLPGSRWKQNNNDKDDLRIWRDKKFQEKAAIFWRDLALELKDNPAIVGYNILNEPHPERLFSYNQTLNTEHKQDIQNMLYNFYDMIITSIRSVDSHTPIILDSSKYADSQAFEYLKPHQDPNVIYSFHMYEPYEYTNYKINSGKFHYPENVAGHNWNKGELEKYMDPVIKFQKSYNIPNNRILVGEFGGNPKSSGLEQYFQDLTVIFMKENWHFAFYAFREDGWDGMDYELGNQKLPLSYWNAIKNNKKPQLQRKDTYPAFVILKKALE